MIKKIAIYLISLILLTGAIALVGLIKFSLNESIRITFGCLYILFIPGFVWSFVFFPTNKIDIIERFLLSIALSIALGPMLLFFLNRVGIKINLINVIWEFLLIIASGGIIYFIKTGQNIISIKKESL